MAEERSSVDPVLGSRLDERILATLEGLQGELAFNGLRRVLRAHPESLARALRRLEREGLVLHANGVYRAMAPRPGGGVAGGQKLRTIAEVELPSGAPPPVVLERLTGRWFGSLRWVGVVERPQERLFAWALRDSGSLVLLGAFGGRLRVLVPDGVGAETADAEDAAYELLVHAVEALRGPAAFPDPAGPGLRAFAAARVGFPLEN